MNELSPSDTEEQLWEKIHAFSANILGVTSILYGFTHSGYLAKRVGYTRSVYIKHSHPSDYTSQFSSINFLDEDLCASILWEETTPFFWHSQHNWDYATPQQQERARLDEEYGMGTGVSMGFRFADGHGIAGIGLACRWMDSEEFQKRWTICEKELLEYLKIFDPLMRSAMVKSRLRLTPRQREVLSLSVGGMVGKQIALRLGVTTKRVEKIFKEIRESLQADTTMEAVAKAIAYKII